MKKIVVVRADALHKSLDEPQPVVDGLDAEPELFPTARIPRLEIPKACDSWLARCRWRLAVHECGHALAGILFGSLPVVVRLVDFDGGGEGHAGTSESDGLARAKVSLAGLAAERLISGEPLPLEGFGDDIRNARASLIETGVSEENVDGKMQRLYVELQRTFAEGWIHSLRAMANELDRTGFLSSDQICNLIAGAQGRTMTKSFHASEPARQHVDRITFPSPNFGQMADDLAALSGTA